MTAKAQFLTELDVRVIDGKRPFMLLKPFQFYSAELDRVLTVPKGYTTDFASIPWWARWYVNINGKSRKPAVVHDFGCDHKDQWGLSQKQVDALWGEGLKVQKIRPTLRAAMYGSVRAYQATKGFIRRMF